MCQCDAGFGLFLGGLPADMRKRQGAFAAYPPDQPLELIGIMSCPGCPTLSGFDKFRQRVRGLTEFRLDAIHFANCIKYLCPFREKYTILLSETYPHIAVIPGTHAEHITAEKFREMVQSLFAQPRRTMIDVILKR